jgi:hypothetical protein
MRLLYVVLLLASSSRFASYVPARTACVSFKKKSLKRPSLVDAIIYVESRGDSTAYNSRENAVGCMQIRPIAVRECNRLVGFDSFTLKDRWSVRKSIDMFNTIAAHTPNPTNEKLARNWNGGPNGHKKKSTLNYWKKVKNRLCLMREH